MAGTLRVPSAIMPRHTECACYFGKPLMNPESEELSGTRYQVGDAIARGGMGEILSAADESLERTVASVSSVRR